MITCLTFDYDCENWNNLVQPPAHIVIDRLEIGYGRSVNKNPSTV